MFIRFVVGSDDQSHRELTGIVTEARLLRERDALSGEETTRLEDLSTWFNENLPCPPFSTTNWGDVVAWFKDDAHESVGRMWDIVALLEEHGRPVRMLRSSNPGRVVYEDQYQVVVSEWNRL